MGNMPYAPRPNELNGYTAHYAPSMGAPMPAGLKMMPGATAAPQHAFAPPPMFAPNAGAQQPPSFESLPPHDLAPHQQHRRGPPPSHHQLDAYNNRFMQPQIDASQSSMQFLPPGMRPPPHMPNNVGMSGGGGFDIGVFQTPGQQAAVNSLGGCWEDPNATRRKFEKWTGVAAWGEYEKRQSRFAHENYQIEALNLQTRRLLDGQTETISRWMRCIKSKQISYL